VAAALKQRKEDGLELLIERGADINLNSGGAFPYPIIAMAYTGDVVGTKFLIEKGADVNKYGGKWHSAIQASTSDLSIGKKHSVNVFNRDQWLYPHASLEKSLKLFRYF
jgi:hypothetical protein